MPLADISCDGENKHSLAVRLNDSAELSDIDGRSVEDTAKTRNPVGKKIPQKRNARDQRARALRFSVFLRSGDLVHNTGTLLQKQQAAASADN